jgi:hypothetical protein
MEATSRSSDFWRRLGDNIHQAPQILTFRLSKSSSGACSFYLIHRRVLLYISMLVDVLRITYRKWMMV